LQNQLNDRAATGNSGLIHNPLAAK